MSIQILASKFHIDIIDGERNIETAAVRNKPPVSENCHDVSMPLMFAQFLDSGRFVFNVNLVG